MINRKYRVWNGSKMIYPDWINVNMNDTEVVYGFDDGIDKDEMLYCTRNDLMESIGLTDFEDRDIYWGDILSSETYKIEDVFIKYGNYEYEPADLYSEIRGLVGFYFEICGNKTPINGEDIINYEYKITGNIFEKNND
jgi:hypothetical protein